MVQMVTGQLGAEGPYWEGLGEGRLVLPRCRGCRRWHWPAVWRCGRCGCWDQEWIEQPLEGVVFTWTRTHHRFGGTEGLAVPYVTVLVKLGGSGIRLMGVLEGDEAELRIGAAVTGRIDRTRYGDATVPSIRWSFR